MDRIPIFRELLSASILLALITSLLYISGASYISSYLTEWGVEPSLIKTNTQEVLIQGATVWFIGGINVVIPALMIGLAVFFPFYLVREISKSPVARKISLKIYGIFSSKNNANLEPPAIFKFLAKCIAQFFLILISLLLFLLFFYQLLDLSSSLGVERALNEYKEFSTNKVKNENIFSRKKTFTIEGKDVKGYLIANSDSLIVLYLPSINKTSEQLKIVPLKSIGNIKSRITKKII